MFFDIKDFTLEEGILKCLKGKLLSRESVAAMQEVVEYLLAYEELIKSGEVKEEVSVAGFPATVTVNQIDGRRVFELLYKVAGTETVGTCGCINDALNNTYREDDPEDDEEGEDGIETII